MRAQWPQRFRQSGVMVYWHVSKQSLCIYSQLKALSSSEVASMIEGVLHHCTTMQVDRSYVDTHGQSEVGFAFCRLLGFQLMPRLKNIYEQKLLVPHLQDFDKYPSLTPILKSLIDWQLIRQQYDEMVKYATALRLETAQTEAILKRFTRHNIHHPTYNFPNLDAPSRPSSYVVTCMMLTLVVKFLMVCRLSRAGIGLMASSSIYLVSFRFTHGKLPPV